MIEISCITKGVIYGINSYGKSNLGLALFGVVIHLTDRQKIPSAYDFYLSMSGRKSLAEFEYLFIFEVHKVAYKYKETEVNTLLEESITIDGKCSI